MTTTAAAPSLVCDELPAVTEPLAWNAGLSFASASSDVSRRGPSSTSKGRNPDVRGLTPDVRRDYASRRGTRPPSIAATARWWLRSAKASCSSREIP